MVAFTLLVADNDIPNTFSEIIYISESGQRKLTIKQEMKILYQT